MIDLSVVMPAYNDSGRIGQSIKRMATFLARWPNGAELLVVDDGSRDSTFDEAEAEMDGAPVAIRLHRHPENRGKGAALRTGMIRTTGRLAGFTDSDLAYAPEVIESFAARLADNDGNDRNGGSELADVVAGRRVGAPGVRPPSAARRLAHKAFSVAVRSILDVPVSDTQCGIKLFRGDAARALFGASRVDGFGFDPEVLHIASRWGLRIVEMDAPLTGEPATSTVSLLKDAPRMLLDLARVRLRRVPPMPAFARGGS